MYYYYFDKFNNQHFRYTIHTNESPFLACRQDRVLKGFELSYCSAIVTAKKYPLIRIKKIKGSKTFKLLTLSLLPIG
ncbi:hypothetical protein DUI34_13240 [Enterococcus faecium]|nr:hypothetical protein [Enterococcus faecium]